MAITTQYTNPIDLLRLVLTYQSWGDNASGTPSANARIRTGVNVPGSFDSATLAAVREIRIAFQVDEISSAYTTELIQKICQQFNLIQYTDTNGYECVKYLFSTDSDSPVKTFSINQRSECGDLEGRDPSEICVNPVINYNYDYATGQYKSQLKIDNVQMNAYNAAYTSGFSGADGQYYWNLCKTKLWPIVKHIEEMDDSLADNQYIVDYSGALFRLQNIVKLMTAKTLSFTVPFVEGKDTVAGEIIGIDFSHLSFGGEIVYSAVVTSNTVSRNTNSCTIEVMFLQEINQELLTSWQNSTDAEYLFQDSYDDQNMFINASFDAPGIMSPLTYSNPNGTPVHITQINDPLNLLLSDMDPCQIGIDTDNDDFTFKNDTGVLYVGAKQKHWSGSDWVYDNIDVGSFTLRNAAGIQELKTYYDPIDYEVKILGQENSGLRYIAPFADMNVHHLFGVYHHVDAWVIIGSHEYPSLSHTYMYGDINFPGLTASRALILNSSNQLQSSPVTTTELGYLSGKNSVIDGSGMLNYFPIFTGANRLGNSIVTCSAAGIEINSIDSGYNGGVRVVADDTHAAGIFLGCSPGGSGTKFGQWSIYRGVSDAGLFIRHNAQDLFVINTLGAITMGQSKTGGSGGSVPIYLDLGKSYSVNPISTYCKLYLYLDYGVNAAGFSVGGTGDVQYHSSWANGRHDFYTADTLRMRITNTELQLDTNTAATAVEFPFRIDLGRTYRNNSSYGANNSACKLFLFRDPATGAGYGLGIGSNSDIQYHNAVSNGTHDFYNNNSLVSSITNSGVTAFTRFVSIYNCPTTQYDATNLELRCTYTSGSKPSISFHRSGYDAMTLLYAGGRSLQIRSADSETLDTVWTTANLTGNRDEHGHQRFWSTSHPSAYYLTNDWRSISGTYRWRIVSNHSDYCSVAHSDLATSAGNADTVDGLHTWGIWNSMGQSHGTFTDFNSANGSGSYFIAGTANGPGTAASQYYGFVLGLGADYENRYHCQVYWPRMAGQGNSPYLTMRQMEGGVWGSWIKFWTGYSDSAGNADTIDTYHVNQLTKSTSNSGDLNLTNNISNLNSFYATANGPAGNDRWYWSINTCHGTGETVWGGQIVWGMQYSAGRNRMWFHSREGSVWDSWTEVWTTANHGAGSGLNADLLDGYHATNFLGKNGNAYYQADNWIQLSGNVGIYNPNSGAGTEFSPTTRFYGSYQIVGSKNDWAGLVLHNSNTVATFMSATTAPSTGVYQQSNNRWQWYHSGDQFYIGSPNNHGNLYMALHSGHVAVNYIPYWNGGSWTNSPFAHNSATDSTGSTLLIPINQQSNYNDGLRIYRSPAGYSLVALGASGWSGTQNGQWTIYSDHPNSNYRLVFNYASSPSTTYEYLVIGSTGNVVFTPLGSTGIKFSGSSSYYNDITALSGGALRLSGATIYLQNDTNITGALSFGFDEGNFRFIQLGTQLCLQKVQFGTWTTVTILG